jgi:rod shape determining protein RodA
MTPFLKKILGMNWILLALSLALAVFGIVVIRSATASHDDQSHFWVKQSYWVAFGIVVFIVVSLVDYRWIRWGALPMYFIGIIFLVMTIVHGSRVNGAKSWLHIGPLNFQPAQLAVIAGIMVLALFLSQYRNMHPMVKLLFCGVITGAPCLLILLQPDLGEVLVWVPTVLAMLFIGSIPLRYLISIIIFGAACIPLVAYFGLHHYQFQRLTAFLDPEIDPKGIAWDINQCLTAIGSGGWAGKGYMAPNNLIGMGYLKAAAHTDYIFTPVAEQWGFLGSVALISAFALLLLTGLYVAYRAADDVGLLVCVGIIALMFTHICQNIGMTIALVPITGVPLPLMSYGGSFVVMVMFGLGLVNSVWVHRKTLGN